MKSIKGEADHRWLFKKIIIFLGILLLLPGNQEDFAFFNPSMAFYQDSQLFLSSNNRILRDLPSFVLINQSSVQAISPLHVFSPKALAAFVEDVDIPTNRNTIIEYIVQEGDSLWSIANQFNVSINTIIWANDLNGAMIRPNQALVILPVSGIKHIVKEGDTLSGIIERYNANLQETLVFNGLSNNENIFVGQVIIVPGGRKSNRILVERAANINIESLSPNQVRAQFSTNNHWGQSHSFPFGQCTWWVAQKRPIGRWGHARSWLNNAERDGFQVCRGRSCLPQVGAVFVDNSHPVYGHVAYVEDVRGNEIIISEMNYIGWGRINKRTIPIGHSSIVGFIY